MRCYTSIIIPGNVKTIAGGAFSYCDRLTSVIMESGVEEIYSGAFAKCENLSRVIIPGSVTVVNYRFSNNYGYADGQYGLFDDCSKLTSAGPIGSGCSIEFGWDKTLPSYALYQCTWLTSITLPEGMEYIYNYACSGCYYLENVDLPDHLLSIGAHAFQGCTCLKEVLFPETVTDIGGYAFSRTALKRIELPDSVTSIGSYAFEYCYSLENVTLSENLTQINYGAFQYCTGLTHIELPDSLTFLGSWVFVHAGLTQITIPNKIVKIWADTFLHCDNLVSVCFPADVEEIGPSAFDSCGKLAYVFYEGNEDRWGAVEIHPRGNDDLKEAKIYVNALNGGAMKDGWGSYVKWLYTTRGTIYIADALGDVSDQSPVFVAAYDQNGKMVFIQSLTYVGDETGPLPGNQVKLLWINSSGGSFAPRCGSAEVTLKNCT